jgi:hypothetical protein
MSHHEALGNPFVAHGAVLLHHRRQKCFLPNSFGCCARLSRSTS